MICPKCGEILVISNITFENKPNDLSYDRYFCFRCDTLFEREPQSGSFIEGFIDELGEMTYNQSTYEEVTI